MKMLNDKLYWLSGIIAQLGIGYCTWQAHWAFTRHWQEVLAGETLPKITDLALSTLRPLPLIVALLMGAGLFTPTLKTRMIYWTLLIILLEAMLLALITLGLGYPAMYITYSID